MTATTPEEERALLAAAAARLDADMRAAFAELLRLIRDEGMSPRDAVAQVMGDVQADMAAAIALGLSAVLERDVTASEVLRMGVGPLQLSARLYGEAQAVGAVVGGIVDRHLHGFADARRLALDLFEGYGFRAPGAEPLQWNRANTKLPRYLREVLAYAPGVERALAARVAQIQVSGLSTGGLRASYSALLAAIARAEQGPGGRALNKRLEVAFFERMRYFAQRIAQTEIHRAYANREAMAMMADPDIKFVQIRRAPGSSHDCICALYAGRDRYGLGQGVYPKALAPLPGYHPYCRCVVSPRLDLDRKTAQPEDPAADAYFLRRLDPSVAARVMGSRAKLDRVLTDGTSADAVVNAARSPAYRVRTVADAA
jgi:hypothetical protein